MVSRAGVVLISGDLVCLSVDNETREVGDWGGKIEKDEDTYQAASRELEEESLGIFRLSAEYIKQNNVHVECVDKSTIFFVEVPLKDLIAFPILFSRAYKSATDPETSGVKLLFIQDILRACDNYKIYEVVARVFRAIDFTNFPPKHPQIVNRFLPR